MSFKCVFTLRVIIVIEKKEILNTAAESVVDKKSTYKKLIALFTLFH